MTPTPITDDFQGETKERLPQTYHGDVIRVVLVYADGWEETLPPEGQKLIDFTAQVG
jgi:hypothetical protein